MKTTSSIRLRDLWRAHAVGWSFSYLLGAVTLVGLLWPGFLPAAVS